MLRRLASLIAVVLLALPAAAQSTIRVEAGFTQQAVYLGDQAVFTVIVENADSVDPPDLSGIPGADFNYRGTSNESRSTVSIVNGRRRESVTKRLIMRWTVTPTELGTVIVPPLMIGVGNGQVVQSDESSIRVLEPETEDRPVVIVRPEATEVFVNQTVRVRVEWLLTADIEGYSFRASRADDGLEVTPLERQRQALERLYEVDIYNGRALANLGYGTLEGRRVRSLEFDMLVTPTRAGELTLGPIAVAYDQRVGRNAVKKIVARSEPVVFTVRELPEQGRPDGFTGLLGTHDIEVRADPTTVAVGDPINLEVTIYGPEPMPGITDGPDLSAIPAFAQGFRIASEGWTLRPASRPGERTFSTVIRVADPSVAAIPPIELPFFDPGEGEYRVARSAPIPLEVRAVREVTAADAVVSSAAPAAVSRDPLTTSAPSVWAIERGPSVLASGDPIAGSFWARPAVLAALALPPACFAAAGAVALARRTPRDPAAARRKRALAEARRVLARDGGAAALRRYLADVFDASPEAITGADGRRLLLEAGLEDPAPVVSMIEAHEAAAYSPGGGASAGQDDGARVESLLREIDRVLARSRFARAGADTKEARE